MFSDSPLDHIETWIFDINGTLIYNPFYYVKATFSPVFLQMNLEIPEDSLLKRIWFSNHRNELIKGLEVDPDIFWGLFNKVTKDRWGLENSSQPYADSIVLDELFAKGKKIAAFTNAPLSRAKIETSLASPNFNGNILSAYEYGTLKPKPDGLLYLMEKMGAKPNTTAYVGNGDEDIQCGNEARVTTVRIYRNEHSITRCGEDFTIDSLFELRKLSGL